MGVLKSVEYPSAGLEPYLAKGRYRDGFDGENFRTEQSIGSPQTGGIQLRCGWPQWGVIPTTPGICPRELERLLIETYKPSPVRRVEIPKPDEV